ncbi:MAG: antitermination protein [Candidatus Pelagibacter sp.]|mgnify:FL=1|nr:antitermination protein [Candidatus Pelagibacter sp.]RPG11612.1 MAG: antitermination protein [Pelagibacteraceae bacterium TMED170]|tara:strand:- start:7974 stop:8396 length:423 start_codon:yes stop_codon:yes gene_type:complete
MIPKNKIIKTPRVKVIQKLYSSLMNPDIPVEFTKSQYKKFIKDVVNGTLEREELIEDTIRKHLSNDINLERTDKLLKIIIFAAIFELMFKHKNSINVIISEYIKASNYFLEKSQIKYLNAILDKIATKIRNENNRVNINK